MILSRHYSLELWISGKPYDIYDWFDATDSPEDALAQAKEEASWMDSQEWFDESVAGMDESLLGCTDWEVKIIKQGDFDD